MATYDEIQRLAAMTNSRARTGKIRATPTEARQRLSRGLTRSSDSTREGLAMKATFPPLDDMNELWVSIPGYERTYKISTHGRVWSIPRPTTPGGLLRWIPDRHGYPMVGLVQDGQQSKRRVHVLVMRSFIGETPVGQEIRHLDGDPTNPSLDNLAFGTHAENMADMVRHGRSTRRNVCKRGHPRVEGNLGVPTNSGSRPCLACGRDRHRAKSNRD